jgi:predicted branched-subunit amino acid permease
VVAAEDSAHAEWVARRRIILRNSAAIGIAVGIYGLSFGALAVAGGFAIWQAMVLSLVMFTGGSQFAYVGVVAAGGSAVAAAGAALLLGARNTLYGVAVRPMLDLRGWQRPLAAHLTIDESTAMALAHEDPKEPRAAQTAFWATGIAVFVGWNLATLVGALGAASLGDPARWGLDAMVPAAFLALLWPRLTSRDAITVALAAGALAIITTPFLPPGLPVLLGAVVAVVAAFVRPAEPGAPRGPQQ